MNICMKANKMYIIMQASFQLFVYKDANQKLGFESLCVCVSYLT